MKFFHSLLYMIYHSTVYALFFSLCVTLSNEAQGGELKSSSVTWTATGSPGFVKINGEGGKAKGVWDVKDGRGSGIFECDMKDFDTGIELRNQHMKEKYLDVKKYPKAMLVIDPVAVSESFQWTGMLTIKGITKAVKGKATIKGSDVTAEFSVSLDDYPGVGTPSHLGITMAKTVDVRVVGTL